MTTISIVTYNHSYSFLEKLISAILSSNDVAKLFIIDNSPTNALELELAGIQVEYIHNPSNPGYGASHNIAIKKSIEYNAKYHFVINPDIYFDYGTLERIVEFLDTDTTIGLLMPQILNTNGTIQHLPKLLPHPVDLLVLRIGVLRVVFSNRLNTYELAKVAGNVSFETPIISGCFSCFRVEAIKNVGFYDERFFMYFEDFDISRRINNRYKTIYFAGAQVYHQYERGAQKSMKLFKAFLSSAIKYFNKYGWLFDSERTMVNRKTLAQF